MVRLFDPCVVPLFQDMAALAAIVGQALSGSEPQTARAWSLLTADDMGLRLGLISLEANTFERSLTVWADLGWVVEVFGVAIADTVFRNYQVLDLTAQHTLEPVVGGRFGAVYMQCI